MFFLLAKMDNLNPAMQQLLITISNLSTWLEHAHTYIEEAEEVGNWDGMEAMLHQYHIIHDCLLDLLM
jgi:hypothetical protein